ncbi:MAG: putative oxidoreductase [Arenicella sp.]|jgi:putative oxidoreductase
MQSANTQQDHAALALRLAFGLILLAHGLLKVFVFTPSGTAAFFSSFGLPEFLP